MKISLPAFLLASALAAPTLVAADDWRCNGEWNDGILRRYSFLFQGYNQRPSPECEDRWGQCFLDRIRHRGLIAVNWQAWKRDDGWWQVDFSTTAGLGWQINNAVQDITHLWRGCWPNK